ncbi:MAG: hypothetical protein ACRCSU_09350 [Paracoccaceae bacterium]
MFGLFGKKPPPVLRAEIRFDEAHNHAAGEGQGGQVHVIPRGTTEILFRFPDFEAFWQSYINGNPHIAQESLIALRDGQAVFAFQVIEGGVHMTTSGVSDDGTILLGGETLRPLDAPKPLAQFEKGAIGIGLYHLGQYRFEVLWATMYQAG